MYALKREKAKADLKQVNGLKHTVVQYIINNYLKSNEETRTKKRPEKKTFEKKIQLCTTVT